jgi:hypothetical protein
MTRETNGGPVWRLEAHRQALMIAYHFPPSERAGAQRPYRLVRYLEQYGYSTHVVAHGTTGAPSPWPQVSLAPGACVSAPTALASWSAAALQRCLPYNDELPWVPQAVAAGCRVAARGRPAVVLSTAPPVACHLAGLVLSRLLSIPWAADFRDPLYGNPARRRRLGPLWDRPIERLIVSRAGAVIVCTDTAADLLARRYPHLAGKIHLIWNGYDPECRLAPRPIPAREYQVILHAGSLYGDRHPTQILTGLHRLVQRGAVDPGRIRLRLVGDFFPQERWVTDSALDALLRLGCVELTGERPAAEARREVAEADYLLLLDLHGNGVGLQVPGKLFEYIQVGRPILAVTGRNSPTERVLAKSGVPHLCLRPDASTEEVEAGLRGLLQFSTVPRPASAWFTKEFHAGRQAQVLAGILDTLNGTE